MQNLHEFDCLPPARSVLTTCGLFATLPFLSALSALFARSAGHISHAASRTKLTRMLCCLAILFIVGCAGESTADFQAEGRKLMQEGNPNGAVVFFKNALEKEPTNFSVRLDLAKAYMAAGKRDQAESEFSKCLVQNAEDPELNLEYGRLLVQTNRPELALKHLSLAEQGMKPTPDSRELVARAYAMLRQPDKSVEALTQALTLEPGRQSSLLMLARARVAQNNAPAAKAIADELLAKDRDSVDVWRLQADLAVLAQDNDHAIASYKELVRLDPLDDGAWYMWGMLLLRQGKEAEAAGVYDKMTQALKNSPHLEMLKGMLAFQANDFKTAATAFQKSLDLRPSLDGFYRLAISQERLGDLETAISSLTRILDTAPEHLPSLQMMATILLKQNRLEDAQQAVEKIITLYPNNANAYNLLGSILHTRGKAQEALAAFQKALDIDPGMSAASMARSSIFLAERAYPEAVKELEQAIDANKANVEARVALFNYYMGRNDLAAAGKVALDGLQESPDNPVLLTLHATLLAGQRKEAEAMALLKKAREGNPDLLAAFNLEMRLHQMAGRRAEALALCDEYLQRHPEDTAQMITSAMLLDGLERSDEATQRLEKAHALGNMRALDILVRRDLAAGNSAQAEQRLVKTLAAKPNGALRAQLAQFYLGQNQFDKAWALYTALEQTAPLESDNGKFVLLSNAGRFEEALQQAQVMIDRDPQSVLGHVAKADALERLNRRDEALTVLETTYRNNQNQALLAAMGELCQRMDNPQKAEDFFRTALVQNPDNQRALIGLGLILLKTGRAAQAVDLYERALSRQPNNVAVLNNLAMAYSESGKDAQRSLHMAMRAYLLLPEDVNVADTLALSLLRAGRGEEAKSLLADVMVANPDSAMLYRRLAQILKELGKTKEGEEAFKKAKELEAAAS